MRFNQAARAAAFALSVLASALPATAQTTVPYSFSAGSPAKAGEVNANFQALATAINALSARLDKAEGKLTAADIVGTYRFQSLQPEIGNGPYVRFDVFDGTITFKADGTITLQASGVGAQLDIRGGNGTPVTGTVLPKSGSGVETGTWSLSGTVVTLDGTEKLYAADGGRLMVSASINPADATTKMIILIRVN
jgi:hypothetical protein